MLDRVVKTIERRRMLSPGMRVGVAVSGGADSVCLLHALRELAPRWDLSLSVLHLDHGLRGAESDADAEFVRALAGRMDLPFTLRRADLAGRTDNLEQAARHARLAFFREQIEGGAVQRVALGHTRSDQAETVLFRLLRGAGSAGLAGIRPVTGDGLVRPLIDAGRNEVEMYLGERGLRWREDSTNRSPAFSRNRIRHQLLPRLASEWNPRIVDTLAQLADWAWQEEEYWSSQIDRMSADVAAPDGDAVIVNTDQLDALPMALRRRIVRRAMERVRGGLLGIDFTHVEAILDLAAGQAGHGRIQLPGIDALRSFDRLRIAIPGTYPGLTADYSFDLPVPGEVGIPGKKSRILTELIENPETVPKGDCVYNSETSFIDRNSVSGPLKLRNWRPGDEYQPAGHAGSHKLKDLFQQARVPLWERRRWPVVDGGEGILWTRRFGPAARCAVSPATRIAIMIREG